MSDWQPIETAPKDGTPILLTDGRHLAGGHREFRIEDAMIHKGYGDEKPPHSTIPTDFMTLIPNPRAGERIEWWQTYGCSALDFETETQNYDGAEFFEPTHWMPLPAPPVGRDEG